MKSKNAHNGQSRYREVMEDSKCWQGCGDRRSVQTVDGNINQYGHYGELTEELL